MSEFPVFHKVHYKGRTAAETELAYAQNWIRDGETPRPVVHVHFVRATAIDKHQFLIFNFDENVRSILEFARIGQIPKAADYLRILFNYVFSETEMSMTDLFVRLVLTCVVYNVENFTSDKQCAEYGYMVKPLHIFLQNNTMPFPDGQENTWKYLVAYIPILKKEVALQSHLALKAPRRGSLPKFTGHISRRRWTYTDVISQRQFYDDAEEYGASITSALNSLKPSAQFPCIVARSGNSFARFYKNITSSKSYEKFIAHMPFRDDEGVRDEIYPIAYFRPGSLKLGIFEHIPTENEHQHPKLALIEEDFVKSNRIRLLSSSVVFEDQGSAVLKRINIVNNNGTDIDLEDSTTVSRMNYLFFKDVTLAQKLQSTLAEGSVVFTMDDVTPTLPRKILLHIFRDLYTSFLFTVDETTTVFDKITKKFDLLYHPSFVGQRITTGNVDESWRINKFLPSNATFASHFNRHRNFKVRLTFHESSVTAYVQNAASKHELSHVWMCIKCLVDEASAISDEDPWLEYINATEDAIQKDVVVQGNEQKSPISEKVQNQTQKFREIVLPPGDNAELGKNRSKEVAPNGAVVMDEGDMDMYLTKDMVNKFVVEEGTTNQAIWDDVRFLDACQKTKEKFEGISCNAEKEFRVPTAEASGEKQALAAKFSYHQGDHVENWKKFWNHNQPPEDHNDAKNALIRAWKGYKLPDDPFKDQYVVCPNPEYRFVRFGTMQGHPSQIKDRVLCTKEPHSPLTDKKETKPKRPVVDIRISDPTTKNTDLTLETERLLSRAIYHLSAPNASERIEVKISTLQTKRLASGSLQRALGVKQDRLVEIFGQLGDAKFLGLVAQENVGRIQTDVLTEFKQQLESDNIHYDRYVAFLEYTLQAHIFVVEPDSDTVQLQVLRYMDGMVDTGIMYPTMVVPHCSGFPERRFTYNKAHLLMRQQKENAYLYTRSEITSAKNELKEDKVAFALMRLFNLQWYTLKGKMPQKVTKQVLNNPNVRDAFAIPANDSAKRVKRTKDLEVTGQIVDMYGKCRALHVNMNDEKITLVIMPTVPFPVPIQLEMFRARNYATVEKLFKIFLPNIATKVAWRDNKRKNLGTLGFWWGDVYVPCKCTHNKKFEAMWPKNPPLNDRLDHSAYTDMSGYAKETATSWAKLAIFLTTVGKYDEETPLWELDKDSPDKMPIDLTALHSLDDENPSMENIAAILDGIFGTRQKYFRYDGNQIVLMAKSRKELATWNAFMDHYKNNIGASKITFQKQRTSATDFDVTDDEMFIDAELSIYIMLMRNRIAVAPLFNTLHHNIVPQSYFDLQSKFDDGFTWYMALSDSGVVGPETPIFVLLPGGTYEIAKALAISLNKGEHKQPNVLNVEDVVYQSLTTKSELKRIVFNSEAFTRPSLVKYEKTHNDKTSAKYAVLDLYATAAGSLWDIKTPTQLSMQSD